MGIDSLIDLDRLQAQIELEYSRSGIPIGLVDADTGEVYISVGWQRVCTDFHRQNPESCMRCIESDTAVKDNLPGKSHYAYKCANGMWDIGIPVYIDDNYSLTLFIGQFFYKEEHPDREYFIRQARLYGYDTKEYLKALNEVPVFLRKEIEEKIEYFCKLAGKIGEEATRALKA